MSGDGAPGKGAGLSFDKAEFSGVRASAASVPAGAQACMSCRRNITDSYFEVGGQVVCPACKEKIAADLAGGGRGPRLVMATLLGGGAALLGAVVWYAVIKTTDSNLGIIAVAVGWLVGRGVAKGARGLGGLGYQFLAAGLSYAAIAGALFPFVLSGITHGGPHTAASPPTDPVSGGTVALAFAAIAALALAAPVVVATSSPLSGLIFCFALWQAWKLNRPAQPPIRGPFRPARPPDLALAVAPAPAAQPDGG